MSVSNAFSFAGMLPDTFNDLLLPFHAQTMKVNSSYTFLQCQMKVISLEPNVVQAYSKLVYT